MVFAWLGEHFSNLGHKCVNSNSNLMSCCYYYNFIIIIVY